MVSKKLLMQLEGLLSKIPSVWDGRNAILEMRAAGYPHWKQMEWIGWYFQFLCEKSLFSLLKIPGPQYGKVEFDGFGEVPWDFKAHPCRDAKGAIKSSVIVNDRKAILQAIDQFGYAGLILAEGEAEYNDEDRSFQIWHKELKGGLSPYEKERILRGAPSRLRKTSFRLNQVDLILLDTSIFKESSSFQEGFRNSNGSPRKAKMLLNLKHSTPIKIIAF